MSKPSKECEHFHTFACGKLEECPTPCARFDFYQEFRYWDDEDEDEDVVEVQA